MRDPRSSRGMLFVSGPPGGGASWVPVCRSGPGGYALTLTLSRRERELGLGLPRAVARPTRRRGLLGSLVPAAMLPASARMTGLWLAVKELAVPALAGFPAPGGCRGEFPAPAGMTDCFSPAVPPLAGACSTWAGPPARNECGTNPGFAGRGRRICPFRT